ncbi:hypothetical protein [Desulforamulus aquiferis]|uniref:Uncharacterized protein n=1 Tax=Desulforamulus aquiferis TaxID=1397668 RepID=A0AAW7ZIA2_9FIRM|nr:hypothetical protein [Desulforamulus aquiferis]MDO7789061.1 hypothetical protein [Desulforamulus aquiferis]
MAGDRGFGSNSFSLFLIFILLYLSQKAVSVTGLSSKKNEGPDIVDEDKDQVGQKVAVGLTDGEISEYFNKPLADNYPEKEYNYQQPAHKPEYNEQDYEEMVDEMEPLVEPEDMESELGNEIENHTYELSEIELLVDQQTAVEANDDSADQEEDLAAIQPGAVYSDEPVLGGQESLFLKPTVMNYPVVKGGSGPKISINYGK